MIYTCPVVPGNCTGLMGNRQSGDDEARDNDYRLYDSNCKSQVFVKLWSCFASIHIANVIGSTSQTDSTILEVKDGQFLGVTLKSTGRTFMVIRICFIHIMSPVVYFVGLCS